MSTQNADLSLHLLTEYSEFLEYTSVFVACLLTAVENGGAGRSKMVALGCVDLP